MDADEIIDDTEDVDDATIVKPRADTFATIRAAFRTAAGPSSSVKPASIVHRLKSTGALGGEEEEEERWEGGSFGPRR